MSDVMTVTWDGTNEDEIYRRLAEYFPEVSVKPDGDGRLQLSYRRNGLRVAKVLRHLESYPVRRMTALEVAQERDRRPSASERLSALATTHPVVYRVLRTHAQRGLAYPDLLEEVIVALVDENDTLRDELLRRALHSDHE